MSPSRPGSDFIDHVSTHLVPPGTLALWWIGQASVILRIGATTIYIDPYLTDGPKRLVAPPCTADQVTNADLILLTHGHGDHLDTAALPCIAAASRDSTIVVPRPLVSRVTELVGNAATILPADAGIAVQWRDVRIVPVAARHEEFDTHSELGHPYLGYVISGDGLTLYHAGDTIPYDGLVETLAPLAIDVALLPINGRDFFRQQRGIAGNLNCREAAELAGLLEVDTVIPIHYGMFAGNTVRPGDFIEALQAKAPHIHALIPGLSQAFLYRS